MYLLVSLGHAEVGHELTRRSAVPVPVRRVQVDDGVAGADLVEPAATLPDASDALDNIEGPRRRGARPMQYMHDFVAAVFDWVIADIAATTQAAVAAAPLKEQSRAGMANIVRTIAAEPGYGRLLFSSQLSNPVVVRKRAESGALMAMLMFQHAGLIGCARQRPHQGCLALSWLAAWDRRSPHGWRATSSLTPTNSSTSWQR